MSLMTAVALTEFPTYSPRDLLPWNLDSGLRSPGACVVDGRAGYIGQAGAGLVYLLASPASRGVAPGPADDRRRSIPWNLYLLDVDAGTVRTIAGDFVEPTGLAVGADGHRVFVSGDRLGTRALWSVDAKSGDCVALAEGNFAYVNAASSGQVVVAQRRLEGDDLTDPAEQIVRIVLARPSP